MNQELGFETMPFEIASEFPGELFEEESEWGRRGSFAGGGSRYSRPGSRPDPRPGGAKRPPIPRPRPILRGPREPWAVIREPYPSEPEPASSERVRWIQDCLNQASGLQLPVTGVMGPETRSAVRSFQNQQGLRASGIVGPDTEEALRAGCGTGGRNPPVDEGDFGKFGSAEKESDLEEELTFTRTYNTTLTFNDKIPFLKLRDNLGALFPKGQRGVYFIYKPKTSLHYVGKGEFINRFRPRKDALIHIGVPDACVEDVWVAWIVVNVDKNDSLGVTRGTIGQNSLASVIAALERYYYFKFRNAGHPLRGNQEAPEKAGINFNGGRIIARDKAGNNLFTLNANF